MATLLPVLQMVCVVGMVLLVVGQYFGLKDERRDKRDYAFYEAKAKSIM